MLTELKNIWRPWNFHYHRALQRGSGNCFEGWYVKVVDGAGAQPFAFIPGVFLGKDPHAFIQVLDGKEGRSWYVRYGIEEFIPHTERFEVQVGQSRFHAQGVELDIELEEGKYLKGKLELGPWSPWPVTFFSPGVMGPYTFVPMMECFHGILSMDHTVSGALEFLGESTTYDGGRGYMEKDWGKGFPEGYVWAHSNHFERPGICISASVAKIPWFTGAFRGFLVGFLLDGTLHRFTTYLGAKIDDLQVTETHMHLKLHNRTHRLEIDAEKRGGALLHAPYEQSMLERVAETMTSTIQLRFYEQGSDVPVFEGEGQHTCLEVQGNTDFLVEG